jgi:MoxR-like ATPase
MRASQCVALLSGKNFVTPDHVKRIANAVLSHRLVLKHAGDAAVADQVIASVLEQVAVPVAPSV